MNKAYERGFMDKLTKCGVNPTKLTKQAALSPKAIRTLLSRLERTPALATRMGNRIPITRDFMETVGRLTPGVAENLDQLKSIASSTKSMHSLRSAIRNAKFRKDLARPAGGYEWFGWNTIPKDKLTPGNIAAWHLKDYVPRYARKLPNPTAFQLATDIIRTKGNSPMLMNGISRSDALDNAMQYLKSIGYAK